MSYLVDTNVISEVRKGTAAHPAVARWWGSIDDPDLYLSVLVIGEIRAGIESLRARQPERAEALETWLMTLTRSFFDRILPVDQAVAEAWGRINARRSLPAIDSLLAATALANDLTLVTRNTRDLEGCGARLLNPFGR